VSPVAAPRRRPRAREFVARVDGLSERVSPPLVVGAIVAAAAVMWGFYSLQVSRWFVQTDELQFVRLAVSIAEELSLAPQIRGARVDAINQLYPLLLAPLYGALPTPAAFKAAHLLNALLMSSAAIPAYLLAREVVSSRLPAYLVAALTVVVPWMAFADMLRADAVAYPVFVWAVLAMQRAVVVPSPRRDAIALAAIGVAFLARTQFLGLALALLLAVALHELLRPLVDPGESGRARSAAAAQGRAERLRTWADSLKRAARGHWLLIAAAAVGAVIVAVRGLSSLLGSYAGSATEGDLLPPGLLENVAKHMAIVAVAVGVIPLALAAAWIVGTLVRPARREAHAFAVLALVTAAILCAQASSFVIRFAGPAAFDRYFFYLAPLAFVAMAACMLEGRRRWLLAAAAAPAFLWLARYGPFAPSPGPYHASPPAVFYGVVEFHAARIGLTVPEALRWGGFAAILAVALALRLFRPRPVLAVTCLLLLVFGVAQTRSVFRGVENTQIPSSIGHPGNPDWVDDAVPEDAEVAMLASLVTIPPDQHPTDIYASVRLWWDTEFWNKSVSDAYVTVPYPNADSAPFSKHIVTPDLDSGRLNVSGVAPSAQAPFLVVDTRRSELGLAGRIVATEPGGALQLVRARRPYQLWYAASGLLAGGFLVPRQSAQLTFWGERRRTVTLELLSPPGTTKAVPYTVARGGRVSRDAAAPTGVTRVPLCLPAGRSRVRLRAGAAAADLADLGADGTFRTVGMRVANVEVRPGC